ncbi:transcriptional regulator [Microbaculum sp. A6E488]|uniref:Transcriptional regulator n=1 Tax=Microbaculum marinisediminis TaxID=2931392 RepID=A0AAW5QWC8_9HYPH|nr:transcriptional regulator [Microbaculum sp. A6E488]MCT8970693.1 transcriptional regulator [Microbaculum sp. A6E488]
MNSITGAQVRAARALVRWTANDLATAAKLGVMTIRRAEGTDDAVSITPANADAIRRALECAGVEFIEENGGGPGVRLKGSA